MNITFENADRQLLEDYAIYVEVKIEMDEMPMTFDQWQETNNAANEYFSRVMPS